MSVLAQLISQEGSVHKQVFVFHKPRIAHAVKWIYECTCKLKGLKVVILQITWQSTLRATVIQF